jgi:hypothetical protein
MKKFALAALILTGAATASNAQVEAGLLGAGVGATTVVAGVVVVATVVAIATGSTTTTN